MFSLIENKNIRWIPYVMKNHYSFIKEWNQFAVLCGFYGNVDNHERAFQQFRTAMSADHENREAFDNKLFEALQDVIGRDRIEIVGSNGNAFVLKDTKIGFCRQLYHDDQTSPSDHSCVVFKRGFTDSTTDYLVQDTTAVVKVTFGEGNCNSIKTCPANKVYAAPTEEKGHGPVAEALLYVLDSWHCLARRGINEEKLHVLVLGGRPDKHSFNDKLCCVDVTLNIPESCSNMFCYGINLAVKFDTSNYEEITIAAYLRVMRQGLERAFKIGSQRMPIPVSLCCRRLSFGRVELPGATLVGSPIPDARTPVQGISVNQGELFRWTPPSDGWVAKTGLVFDYSSIRSPILIKVQCVTVHRSKIDPDECFEALVQLKDSGNDILLKELAKVVIAYNKEARKYCNIMVMHDISQRQDARVDVSTRDSKRLKGESCAVFKPLIPKDFEGKMSQLWKVFSKLVTSMLVPMADAGVVHADIRPGWKHTSNILCRDNDGNVELRLIGLDSLSTYPLPTLQDNRCMQCWYSTSIENIYQFVWWQVLHVAYIWSEQLDNDDCETLLANNLVNDLFETNEYKNFKNFLGKQWDKEMGLDNIINKESVEILLNVVAIAFNRKDVAIAQSKIRLKTVFNSNQKLLLNH